MNVLIGAQASFISSSTILMTSSFALQFILSASLSQLWGMINALQIITCLPAFNLLFPSNAQFLLSMIIQLANFQMLDPSSLLVDYMPNNPSESEAVPEGLSNLGFSTTNIISNEGMVFGSFAIAAGLAVIDKIMLQVRRNFPDRKLIGWAYEKLHSMVYFSMMLRPLIEAYLNAVIGSLLALYSMNLDTKLNAVYATLTVIINLFYLLFPILTFFFLKKFQIFMTQESFRTKYESLYEGLKVDKDDAAFGIYQVPFFLFRRLILAFTIVCIPSFVVLQLLIQSLVSLFYLRFLIECQPYETKKLNQLEIFNELTISSCFHISYLFTDYIPEVKRRYFVGWLLTVLVLLNVLVNFIGNLMNTIFTVKEALLSWRKRQAGKNKVVAFETIETKSEFNDQNRSVLCHTDNSLFSNALPQNAELNFTQMFAKQQSVIDNASISQEKENETVSVQSIDTVFEEFKSCPQQKKREFNKQLLSMKEIKY